MCVNGKEPWAVSASTFKYHTAMSTPTSTSTPPMTATVLSIKHYPIEEIVILLDGSPAVVTLRNVKINEMNGLNMDLTHMPSVATPSKNMTIDDVVQGAWLLLVEPGTWNVNTATFDNCQVLILEQEYESTNTACTQSKPPSVVPLPARRKRKPMQ